MQKRGRIYALLSGTLLLCSAAPAFALAPGATIATGDMNGDGIPDIVTLEPNLSQVDIVTVDAKGDFNLAPSQGFLDISDMTSIALADLNGDGINDVIVSDGSGAATGVRVLFNHGHGTLAADLTYPSETGSGGGPASVTAADLDGDGFPDLVTANGADGTVSVLLNHGDGTFAAPASFPAGTYPVTVAVADVDDDGLPDLLVADAGGDSVQVLINDGQGGFVALRPKAAGAHPVALTLSDFDGDGKIDVVVVNRDDNTAGILFGHGDGSFAPAIFLSTGSQPGWVAALDLNADGWPDLITANYRDGSVSVFTNGSGNSFVAAQPVFPAYGSYDTVVMSIGGEPQLVSTNVPAGTVVVTPAEDVMQGGSSGSPVKGTVHHINGARDPQSSAGGGGDLDLLGLTLLSIAALRRRFTR